MKKRIMIINETNGKSRIVKLNARIVAKYFREIIPLNSNLRKNGQYCQRCGVIVNKERYRMIHIWNGFRLCEECYHHKVNGYAEATPDLEDIKRFKQDPSILLINVTQPYMDTIDQINACDWIISTSLHGCIVSEAYGKPVAWLSVSDRILGANYKFNDYLRGFRRGGNRAEQIRAYLEYLKITATTGAKTRPGRIN